jgi:WD40 repeat protein
VLLAHFDGPIVLFVDEIDAIRNLPFPADEFFAGIRECHNRRAVDPNFNRLTFCLLGVASPAELIADPSISPFNVGRRVELTDFTPEEAAPLARGLAGGLPVLDRILHWTGGHPYLTQRLGAAAAEEGARTSEDIDRLCDQLFLGRGARDRDDNLLFVQDRLLKTDGDVAALLDLYGKVRAGRRIQEEDAGTKAEALRLSGIARIDATGLLRVRNRIYEHAFDRDWVRANLPGAERERQRVAYRRGLVRAAAICGALTVAFGALAWEAVIQARSARAKEDEAKDLLYAADMYSAQQAIEQDNAPRALQLLGLHTADPRRDFAYGLLWNRIHAERFTFHDEPRSLYAVTYSPDGRRLATANSDGLVRLWDASNGHLVGTLVTSARTRPGSNNDIKSIVYSPDERWLATGDNSGEVSIWDGHMGSKNRVLHYGASSISSVAFSPDGRSLAAAGSDGAVVWDLATGTPRPTFGAGRGVWRVAFSPDGLTLAATGMDGAVHIWDEPSGRPRGALRGYSRTAAQAAAFSPDGKWLATSDEDTAILWDWRRGMKIHVLPSDMLVKTVAFSPDSRDIAIGGDDLTVRVYDVATVKLQRTFLGHTRPVNSVAYSPNGKFLASASSDGTTRVWDTRADDAIPLSMNGTKLQWAAFSPNGNLVATVISEDPRITIWNAQNGQPFRQLSLPGGTGVPGPPTFSPDARQLSVACSDFTLRTYDVATGREIRHEPEPIQIYYGLAVSPDGQWRVAGTRDPYVHLWHPDSRDAPIRLTGHKWWVSAAAFSRDGHRLITGGYAPDSSAIVWDMDQRRMLHRLEGHRGHVQAVAFSLDGREVATGGYDGTVRLWHVATGRETLTLSGSKTGVIAVGFTSDGGTLRSIDADGVIHKWRAGDGLD